MDFFRNPLRFTFLSDMAEILSNNTDTHSVSANKFILHKYCRNDNYKVASTPAILEEKDVFT
jgi:hypothetical protein